MPWYDIRRPTAAAGARTGKTVSHPMAPHTPTRAGRIVRRAPRLVELSGTESRAEDTTTWTAVALDDRPPVARRPPCGRCRGTGFVYLWSVDNHGASVWFCDRCKRQWAELVSAQGIADGRSDRAAVGGDAAAPVVSERSAAPACEHCGGASARIVSLVDADMAQGDHPLCDPCWAYLVEGLRLRQPWVRSPDPRALYLTTTRAWELMDEAAAQPA